MEQPRVQERRGGEIKNRSQMQVAVQAIKGMILKNELQAGSSHLESELAQKLGMSRTPVREATLILEAQGLLEVIPRRGVRISTLSTTDMTEIYQILTELESLSAELAATGPQSPDDITAAEYAIADMDKALENDDREAWAVADEAFHACLVRLGGNSRIATIFDMYNDQVRRARALTLYLRPNPSKSNEDHRSVLKAIKERDGKMARKIHTSHRVQAGLMLTELLKKYGFHQV